MNHNDFHGEVRNFVQADLVVHEAAKPIPPWELCFKPYDWTDRADKIDLLAAYLAAPEPRPVLVTGPSGAGKTALAGVVTALVRDDYPDGVLHLEPARHGGFAEMVSALERLGCGRLPETPAAVEKLYQSALASKRMVVVLDGPADRAEIERFWPRTATVAFIVLTGRPIRWRHARTVELGPLEPEHAAALLEAAAGLGPDVVAKLVEAFGGLPGRLLHAGGIIADGSVSIEELLALASRHDDHDLFLRSFESIGGAAQRVYRALSHLPQPVVEQSLLDWFDANAGTETPAQELKDARLLVAIGTDRWQLRLDPNGEHPKGNA